MKKSAIALAFPALCAVSGPLLAAGIDEEIVVTTTRSPYELDKSSVRVRVISSADIARTAASSLEELLRSEGSLQVRDSIGNGRFVSLSVRGMAGGQNALVLVDGRRLNNADLSDPDLTTITLADVERVEILEGGAGVLFGDQAVGGVINVITRQGGERGGQLKLGGGSYNRTLAQLAWGDTLLDDSLDYRVSAKRERADGYRDETDIDYGNLRGELGYSYAGGRVFVEAQDTDNNFLLPGALQDVQLAEDRRQAGSSFNDYRIDSRQYRLGIDQGLGDNLRLLMAYGNRDEEASIAGRSISFGASQTYQQREVETLDPRLVGTFGQWRFTLGSDLENYDYQLAVNSAFGTSVSAHEHERRSQYLQGIYSPSDTLQISAGIRHASLDVDVDGGYFTASYDDSVDVKQVGLSYRPTESLRIYVNRDETFRFPVADENVDFLGNVVALDPQEGVAWDLGLDWQWRQLDGNLVVFDHALENEIGYDTSVFANVNFDDTKRRGATLDLAWQLVETLQMSASYTHMRAEFDGGALDGNRIPAVAEQLGKVRLAYTPAATLSLYGEAVYTGSLAVDMRGNAPQVNSFTVYNLAARYQWQQLALSLRLNNIFGKEYSEYVSFFGSSGYYPSPEENATLDVVYEF